MAVNAPVELSKILHVPVLHASHHATNVGVNFPSGEKEDKREVVGASQIIDKDGKVLKRKMYNEESEVLYADIKLCRSIEESFENSSYWIPEMPQMYLNVWDYFNAKASEYYENISKKKYKLL